MFHFFDNKMWKCSRNQKMFENLYKFWGGRTLQQKHKKMSTMQRSVSLALLTLPPAPGACYANHRFLKGSWNKAAREWENPLEGHSCWMQALFKEARRWRWLVFVLEASRNTMDILSRACATSQSRGPRSKAQSKHCAARLLWCHVEDTQCVTSLLPVLFIFSATLWRYSIKMYLN